MTTFIARLAIISALVLALLISSTGFASITESTVSYNPIEISSVLNNPYMGWAPWASGGPYQQPHRLVYINATWRELEPEKGNYAFSTLESRNKFSYWDSKGVKIILRINMDYPGSTSHKDIPEWLYNEINGDGTWYDIDWGKGFSPNYNNPKLIEYHEELIAALALRYNNDNRLPMIAVGSLGQWGEFHTKKSNSFTIPFPKVEISDQYVQPYIDFFTNKHLLMRRPFQIAKDNNMGLFNDSFGSRVQTYDYFNDYIQNGYQDYMTGDCHPAMADYWKTAPSGGEIANYPGTMYLEDSTIEASLQMLADSHTSWLGPCSPCLQSSSTTLQHNYDRMLTTMGYRFSIQSVSHCSEVLPGDNLSITMNWANKGVAPFYYSWPLELSLADASGNITMKMETTEDIRTWLPGTKQVSSTLKIPQDLAAGVYTLCVGIIDPETGLPGIDLAIEGRRSDGRYSLGQITVREPEPEPEPITEPEPEPEPVPSIHSSLVINGSTYVEIPRGGVTYSDYSATIRDQYDVILPNAQTTWSIDGSADGVTLDPQKGKLIVSPSAKPGNIKLTATSATNTALQASKTLILYASPEPIATSINITGSTYIEVPQKGVTYSDYKANVKDQYDTVMSGEDVIWSLNTTLNGVTLNAETGKITVTTKAKSTTAILTVVSKSNNAVKEEKTLIFIR